MDTTLTTPNDVNVEQFAYHLLAGFEQLAQTEKRPGASSVAAKGEQPKVKSEERRRRDGKVTYEKRGRKRREAEVSVFPHRPRL